MDFVFDLNKKNWPILNEGQVQLNEIIVMMEENGFKAVTNCVHGSGQAILNGNRYEVQLPGQVIDENKLKVKFARVNT